MLVTMQQSVVDGKGLFATQNIEPGDEIFSIARPLASAVEQRQLHTVCSNCFGPQDSEYEEGVPNQPVRACNGCKLMHYCSKQCQTESWKRQHKHDCRLIGKLSELGQLPSPARVLLQMLQISTKDGPDVFAGMRSHLPDIVAVAGNRHDSFESISLGIHNFTGTKLGLDFVRNCFALVITNAISVLQGTMDSVGTCLDPLIARLNHSCDPNAFIMFDGPRAYLQCLKPISVDEEVNISYIDNSEPFERRQNELLERYYFKCHCTKCQFGANLPCDELLQSDEAGKAVSKGLETQMFKLMTNGRHTAYPADKYKRQVLDQDLELCRAAGVWPEQHYPIPAIRAALSREMIAVEDWYGALLQNLKLYFYSDPIIYPQTFHPIRVVRKWAILKLTLAISADARADTFRKVSTANIDLGCLVYGFLTELCDNVKYSHGIQSYFARNIFQRRAEFMADITPDNAARLAAARSNMVAQWTLLKTLVADL